jgi:hypothetical protein
VPGHVFISYRHGDKVPYVERLADYLTSESVPVWFDREIVTGDRWDHVIRSKIDTCAALVVVMTPQAEESDWVAREIDQAELMNKPIFPLLLDGRRFFRLSNLQYEDVTGARMPTLSFVARLRTLLAEELLSETATGAPSSAAEPVAESAPSSPLFARPIITIPTPKEGGPRSRSAQTAPAWPSLQVVRVLVAATRSMSTTPRRGGNGLPPVSTGREIWRTSTQWRSAPPTAHF